MKKKESLYQKLLRKYRKWKKANQQKTLNRMVVYSMDEAIRLSNKKRDIINNKVWAIAGSGEYLIFCRFQKKNLQTQGLLKPHLTGKDLDEMASYIALPYTEKDHRRGGILRRFIGIKK